MNDARPAPAATPPLASDLRSLLIVCPSWVGDTVMSTPVLRAARQRLPDATIVAAGRPGIGAVLAGAPWIDRFVAVDMSGFAGPVRAARALAGMGVEAALLLPNSFRSALAVRLARIPVRVGYARDGRGLLLTHSLRPRRTRAPTAMTAYYAGLGDFALGPITNCRQTELFVTTDEDAAGARLLRGVETPFVLLNPGANRPDKRWPAARFAHLADDLLKARDLPAVVSGAPNERPLLRAVVDAARSEIVDLAERGITLGALKAVIRRAALVITNDTGPRHLAAALGTPVVSLFGPTDHRWTTLDATREHLVVAEPFLPESLVADRHPRACGIDRIPVSDVLFASMRLLDQPRRPEPT